jgi:hypothetical protein
MKMDSQFTKIIVCSGHMIDQPTRSNSRFPPEKEEIVRGEIIDQLQLWQIDSKSLAICSGAQGADILFIECCLSLGAKVHLLIPLPQPEFLARSVHLHNTNWEDRYFALLQQLNVSVFFLEDFLAKNPEKFSIALGATCGHVWSEVASDPCVAGRGAIVDNIFAQNNLWIIHTAQTMLQSAELFAILVWDEQSQGDGPGGTADFADRIHQAQGTIAIINPTKLTARP